MANMIFAQSDGQWFDFPGLELAAMSGNMMLRAGRKEMITLPEGATLTMMPMAKPWGFDRQTGQFKALEYNPYEKKDQPVWAMAALLPQGFTRTLLPAALPSANPLPLLGYTAVGIEKNRLVVAAVQTDAHEDWHPQKYNTADLPNLVTLRQKQFPQNRIIRQLAFCAENYGCFTAQNIFYRRKEGGIPVSPVCNADCIGCISSQPSQCCPSPQQRIDFVPTVREVVEIAVPHLQKKDTIISFGQGCEGEPTQQADLLAAAIKEIRQLTNQSMININTNAGDSRAIEKICAAGVDSLRISLFSPIDKEYQQYHRPHYQFSDVCRSLAVAKRYNVSVSLNLLTYPGFTDRRTRLEALMDLVDKYSVRQIQLRNLNIDPRIMNEQFCDDLPGLGILYMLDYIKKAAPDLYIGNYSRRLDNKK
ncbi:MAG: radical SAM protein [Bacillota bacterium]|jgi:pyruvate-formate lyase-activating enzyme